MVRGRITRELSEETRLGYAERLVDLGYVRFFESVCLKGAVFPEVEQI
jgi:hypothetical protein